MGPKSKYKREAHPTPVSKMSQNEIPKILIQIQIFETLPPEAHPTEGGDYLDYFLPVSKHKSLQQRLDAAG